MAWLVAIDGTERRVDLAPIDWRDWRFGRDVLVDGIRVHADARMHHEFPYGPVIEHEFMVGAHRCAIRTRPSKVWGNPETAILVDGEVQDARTPEDEREREARGNRFAVAVVVVILLVIVVLNWSSWIDAYNRAPL